MIKRMVHDIILIEMSQELDDDLQEDFIQEIKNLLETDPPKAFLFNLGKIGVINSQALSTLVIIQRLLNDHNKKFGAYNMSEINLEVFELSQLDQIIPIFATEEEALEAVQ